MAYVVKDDIILSIENEQNFIKGNSSTYELFLFKDFIGNPLNLNDPTSIHVALYSADDKVLQYSNPQNIGNSDVLNVYKSEREGKIGYTITIQQSNSIPNGALYAEVTVMFENYYPQPKIYVFPRIKLGEAIANPDDQGGDTGDGNTGGSTNNNSVRSPQFTIEHVDGSNPTNIGLVSMNSNIPTSVNEIIFRNLDASGTRITMLENFLTNRIGVESIEGTILIADNSDSNMFAIYKIVNWERIDITDGNGDSDNSDGIKINVLLENKSYGPGVTKSLWEVGQEITYELDAIGLNRQSLNLMPDGILTYVDKHLNSVSTLGMADEVPTGINISYSPYQDSYVMVEVNGISVEIGDGLKNTPVYFSGNNGLTATTIEEIRTGDQLIWNNSIANYELEVDDVINLIYEAKSEDLR